LHSSTSCDLSYTGDYTQTQRKDMLPEEERGMARSKCRWPE